MAELIQGLTTGWNKPFFITYVIHGGYALNMIIYLILRVCRYYSWGCYSRYRRTHYPSTVTSSLLLSSSSPTTTEEAVVHYSSLTSASQKYIEQTFPSLQQLALAALLLQFLGAGVALAWYISLPQTSVAGNNAVYQSSSGFVFLFQYIFLPIQRTGPSIKVQITALIISLTGVMLITFAPTDSTNSSSSSSSSIHETVTGYLWVLLSTVAYAMYEICYALLIDKSNADNDDNEEILEEETEENQRNLNQEPSSFNNRSNSSSSTQHPRVTIHRHRKYGDSRQRNSNLRTVPRISRAGIYSRRFIRWFQKVTGLGPRIISLSNSISDNATDEPNNSLLATQGLLSPSIIESLPVTDGPRPGKRYLVADVDKLYTGNNPYIGDNESVASDPLLEFPLSNNDEDKAFLHYKALLQTETAAFVLGCMGLFTLVCLLPFFPILHYTNVEEFVWPANDKVRLLALNTGLDSIYNLSLLVGISVSSPLAMSIATMLVVPASIVADWLFHQLIPQTQSIIGMLLIFIGFSILQFPWKQWYQRYRSSWRSRNTTTVIE